MAVSRRIRSFPAGGEWRCVKVPELYRFKEVGDRDTSPSDLVHQGLTGQVPEL